MFLVINSRVVIYPEVNSDLSQIGIMCLNMQSEILPRVSKFSQILGNTILVSASVLSKWIRLRHQLLRRVVWGYPNESRHQCYLINVSAIIVGTLTLFLVLFVLSFLIFIIFVFLTLSSSAVFFYLFLLLFLLDLPTSVT